MVESGLLLLFRGLRFGLVAVLLCFGENLGNVARRDVRDFGVVDAERNLPRIHVGLHAVAFAFADQLLAERFDFGNFVAFHDDGELLVASLRQEHFLFSALPLEERRKICKHAVRHFVAELADDVFEVIDFHDQDEKSLARILVLADELQVVDKSHLVVHAGERVRRDSELEKRHVNMQKRERENRVDERNFGNEILDDAGDARDECDEREVKGLFPVRGVLLRDGVLHADDHCRDNVDEV